MVFTYFLGEVCKLRTGVGPVKVLLCLLRRLPFVAGSSPPKLSKHSCVIDLTVTVTQSTYYYHRMFGGDGEVCWVCHLFFKGF